MKETKHLSVGRIVGTHGIRGEVRVLSNTDFPKLRFAPKAKLLLSHKRITDLISVEVEKSRPHKNLFLLKFVGWDRVEEAEPWRNAELMVPISEAALEELKEDEYYFHQIIGCTIQTKDGKTIGKVKEIYPLPANDVWVIEPVEKGKEILLPFVKEIVKEVDLAARRIIIEWMEGLESS